MPLVGPEVDIEHHFGADLLDQFGGKHRGAADGFARLPVGQPSLSGGLHNTVPSYNIGGKV